MCLIVFAWREHPRYLLVFAANRDEFYDRPTVPARFWDDAPHVLAGRDERAGGTWMGLARDGRFAAVTNHRDPSAEQQNAPSRGALVADYLRGEAGPHAYLDALAPKAARYNGFNLLAGGPEALWYFSNRSGPDQSGVAPARVRPGVHGLSNAVLDTPWPKVEKSKAALGALLEADAVAPEALLDLLSDAEPAPDGALPQTGVPEEWERALSSVFIETEGYGTRSSTALLVERSGEATFVERIFRNGEVSTQRFSLQVEPFSEEEAP